MLEDLTMPKGTHSKGYTGTLGTRRGHLSPLSDYTPDLRALPLKSTLTLSPSLHAPTYSP